jgi:hypothetical protein
MTSPRLIRAITVLAMLMPLSAWAGTLQRFTLIVGANNGGADRPQLKYAVSDADRFARVMLELGGVSPENEIVLKEPGVAELLAALARLHTRLAAAQRGAATGGRTEVFIYYSGHADEKGLLLGEDRLSYQTLRDRLDDLPADVRIAVLDACASGAFTRLKGGRKRPPFLVDESASMRGHAILTSSAETEAAQESDRIRASYFTHYLVSGFRGAADVSGDGRVTLHEAYQFAFSETLGRTVDTRGGAQHPSYDINLSGAGDVVITDVRQTTARLVLAEGLEGRFFIRTAAQGLVVELYKPRGRAVEIGLEPGAYEVRVEREQTALLARTTLADGGSVVLDAAQFGVTTVDATRRRGAGGGGDLAPYRMDGRSRLMFQTGVWGSNGNAMSIFGIGFDVHGGLHYAWFARESLAVTGGVTAFGAEQQVDIIGGVAVPIGLQWYPRGGTGADEGVKPYLAASVLPVTSADYGTSRRSTVGVHLGAGLEFYSRHAFVFSLSGGYNAVPRLNGRPNLQDNFQGLTGSMGFGFVFGQGR